MADDRVRVLVDATAVPEDRAGVGRYVDELLGAFGFPVVITCQARDEAHYRRLAPAATILPQRGIQRAWARFVWEQVVLPSVAARAGVSVIHSPHYTLPLFTRRARVVTFHDATFFSDPSVHMPVKRVFFRWWLRASSRLANAVIVPSAATATEIARFITRLPAGGYRVIHHGVDPAVFHHPDAAELAAARDALGLPKQWIAFLGTLEPRKNLSELLAAYATVARNWHAGELPVLALAGASGWGREIESDIAAVPAPGSVIRLGFIELDRLRDFLGGAVLVAYPSLGEGFGLPVLEGMASGAAVLTTRRLALPEVGGDAVAYCEPDRDSLAEALEALLNDPQERARLARLGIARAASFTWAAAAEAHREVYAGVA